MKGSGARGIGTLDDTGVSSLLLPIDFQKTTR